jgi:hypothetical protein
VGQVFFEQEGTIMKKKPHGPVETALTYRRTWKDCERGHLEESNPFCSRRHAVELGMSESIVRRILYKMACNNV